jgi:hypothetical protein
MIDATSEGDRGTTSSDPQQFAAALDELKQMGCVVLVTGAVDVTVRAASSRRLFGALSCPHQRVIVHPNDTALRLASYLPHGITPTSSTVQSITGVQLRGDEITSTDSTPPAEGHTSTDPPPDRTTYGYQFDALLAETRPTTETFAPGELRVGILTLGELLDQYGQPVARTALRAVRRQMRARHGIGHCHLPVASESAVATALVESADIHVRLREREGHPPEQCWYLCDSDCCSAWLPLDTYS